jgi:ABC-type transporter Mla subunit MlaD
VYYYTTGTLNGLNATIGTVNRTLNSLHGTIATVQGTLNGLHGTIGTVNRTLNGLHGTVRTENGTLNGLYGIDSNGERLAKFAFHKLLLFIIFIITIYLFIYQH